MYGSSVMANHRRPAWVSLIEWPTTNVLLLPPRLHSLLTTYLTHDPRSLTLLFRVRKINSCLPLSSVNGCCRNVCIMCTHLFRFFFSSDHVVQSSSAREDEISSDAPLVNSWQDHHHRTTRGSGSGANNFSIWSWTFLTERSAGPSTLSVQGDLPFSD